MERAKVKRNEMGTEKEQTVPKYQRPRNDSSTSLLSTPRLHRARSVHRRRWRSSLYISWFMPRSITKRGHARESSDAFWEELPFSPSSSWDGSTIWRTRLFLKTCRNIVITFSISHFRRKVCLDSLMEKLSKLRHEFRSSITSYCNNKRYVKRLQRSQ